MVEDISRTRKLAEWGFSKLNPENFSPEKYQQSFGQDGMSKAELQDAVHDRIEERKASKIPLTHYKNSKELLIDLAFIPGSLPTMLVRDNIVIPGANTVIGGWNRLLKAADNESKDLSQFIKDGHVFEVEDYEKFYDDFTAYHESIKVRQATSKVKEHDPDAYAASIEQSDNALAQLQLSAMSFVLEGVDLELVAKSLGEEKAQEPVGKPIDLQDDRSGANVSEVETAKEVAVVMKEPEPIKESESARVVVNEQEDFLNSPVFMNAVALLNDGVGDNDPELLSILDLDKSGAKYLSSATSENLLATVSNALQGDGKISGNTEIESIELALNQAREQGLMSFDQKDIAGNLSDQAKQESLGLIAANQLPSSNSGERSV